MAQVSATTASTIPNRGTDLQVVRVLGHICFVAGFASIIASILVWQFAKTPDAGHGERFGIFVGLWAPTFFALSDRLDRYGKERRGVDPS